MMMKYRVPKQNRHPIEVQTSTALPLFLFPHRVPMLDTNNDKTARFYGYAQYVLVCMNIIPQNASKIKLKML